MPHRFSRRHFLQTTAAASAASLLGHPLLAQEKKLSANEKLAVGVIGVTNQAEYNLNQVAGAGAAVVALCDVDENIAGKAR
jgi:hypothetical protein